jgi:non-ribosomal peptide synthetase component F
LTGERDVTLGTLAAGRDRPELVPLIGLFLNALPLRIRVDRAAGLRGTLASARDATLGALAHAELPFERIVAETNPPRQPRRNPLFDVVLNDLPPASVRALGDLEVAATGPGPEVGAPFDVMWRVVADDDRLVLRVEYRRGRFAEPRIREWLARYLDRLARAAAG